MSQRVKDMTAGKPAKLIVLFALPLMLGNIFQQLYSMVDTMIVGRGIGVEALAALGAADWLNWMMLGIIVGFAQGFSILTAQHFGAGDYSGLRKSVAMSAILGAGIAAVLAVLSQLIARPVLEFLNTPANILEDALTYLRIAFLGIPVIMAYNVLSAVLRALGDGKTPLYAMIIAAFINIALDLLFVMVFRFGVGGAAAATVIAQLFSALYCLKAIVKIPILKIKKSDFRPDGSMIRRLTALGIPSAFQNMIIAVGGLAVQYVINGFGFIFVAGFTATNKLYGLLELAATSFGFSMSVFAGQNLGAGKYGRIREGMRSGVKMTIAVSVLISAVMLIFGRFIVGLFVTGSPDEVEQVVAVAYHYLSIMSYLLWILYLLHLYRSALQGMGDTVTPMISGIIELVMRVSAILILPHLIGEEGIYFAEIAAWIGAEVLLMIQYYRHMRKLGSDSEKQIEVIGGPDD